MITELENREEQNKNKNQMTNLIQEKWRNRKTHSNREISRLMTEG